MATLYTQTERNRHIEQWRTSGLSQKAYCRQSGLSWTTFKNWHKRNKLEVVKPLFAPLQITPTNTSQWIIETADGLRVHVPANCDETSLHWLINALRSSDAS